MIQEYLTYFLGPDLFALSMVFGCLITGAIILMLMIKLFFLINPFGDKHD